MKVAGPGKVERVRVRVFSAAGATVNAVITGFLENFENAIQKIKITSKLLPRTNFIAELYHSKRKIKKVKAKVVHRVKF